MICLWRSVYRTFLYGAETSGHDFILKEREMGDEVLECVDCGAISNGHYGKRI